jgi:hypothetical protein
MGRSVMVYETAKNYRLFEFYWDPSKDSVGFIGQPNNIPGTSTPGTPAGTQPGTLGNPNGTSPTGTNPQNPPLQGNPPQQ